MSENALDRLMKEAQLDGAEPKYSIDEMIETDNEEENFLEKMSDMATTSLKTKIKPESVEEDDEEEIEVEETKAEKVEIEKPERAEPSRKTKKTLKNKKDKTTKLDEFMNSLANECIDIMIQSGVTIHNFNESQMNIIWDYIKSRI